MQWIGGVVRPEVVILNLGSHEGFEFDIAALDPPTRQHLRQPLHANDTLASEILCVVPIESAGEHNLQQEPILVEATWSNDETAVCKSADAPDVPAGKKHNVRVVEVIGTRRACRRANTAQDSGGGTGRRPNAPPVTHGTNP